MAPDDMYFLFLFSEPSDLTQDITIPCAASELTCSLPKP